MIFHDEGGGGVSQKVFFYDEGRRGGPDPPKKDDIIYEQPLIFMLERNLFHYIPCMNLLHSRGGRQTEDFDFTHLSE